MVNQAAYLVVGYDVTISMCAEGGQLQLNAFEPTIGYAIFESQRVLTAAAHTLRERCVDGHHRQRRALRQLVMNSVGIVTVLLPVLGYEKCSEIAKKAIADEALGARTAAGGDLADGQGAGRISVAGVFDHAEAAGRQLSGSA